MILTTKEISYLRLYKQGLIKKFKDIDTLFWHIEIQSQSAKDALFNVNSRLMVECDLNELRKVAIRIWYIRNTLFYISKKKYEQAVGVNNYIGNWFNRKYLFNQKANDDFDKIKNYCLRFEKVSSTQLLENDFNDKFIKNWGGVFIELTRLGIVYNKENKFVDINKSHRNFDFSIEKLMKDYFRIYGPATLNDFKHWFGYSSKKINLIFENIKSDFLMLDDGNLIYKEDLNLLIKQKQIPIIILGKFDNICLSYSDKSWLIDQSKKNEVWGKAGIVEAVVLVNGKIVAVWRQQGKIVKIKLVRYCDDNTMLKIKQSMKKKFKDLKTVRFVDEF